MAQRSIKPDAQIREEVLRELQWDARVEESGISVEVDDGVVALTGTVSSYAKRVAAQEASHRVAGVLDVANDIQVRVPSGQERTDTEIAHAVREALKWDAHVPDERILTTVSQGWVTLEGTVDFWSQKDEAERAVLRLSSVYGVTNTITVGAPSGNAAQVRKAIEEALERRVAREARALQVKVEDGKVTLMGYVQSWRDKRAIVDAVSHAAGVREIEDHLRIDPYS